MYSNFISSLNVVLPIFTVIIFGYYLRKTNFFSAETVSSLNKFVFKFGLPAGLFISIYNSDFSVSLDYFVIGYSVATLVCMFFIAWAIAEIFMKDKTAIGAFVQGSFRSNYNIVGMILLTNIFGADSMALPSLLNAFIIPVLNIFSVLILVLRNRNYEPFSFKVLKNVCMSVMKNPLIIGVVLGLSFNLLPVNVPEAVLTSVDYVGKMSSSTALLALGGTLTIENLEKDKFWSAVATSLKLVIFPIIFVSIAYFGFGVRDSSLYIFFVVSGSSTAISSFVMAQNMESNENLALNIVVYTTMFSIITFTIGVFIIKSLGIA